MSLKRISFLIIASCALLVACNKKDAPSGAVSAADGANLLEYVPADTPYFAAQLHAAPEDFMEKFKPITENLMDNLGGLIEAVAQNIESEDDPQFQKVIEALSSRLTAEGIEAFGFGEAPTFAIYGYGLLPVLRVNLADPVSFGKELARLEADLGFALQADAIGKVTYRYVDSPDGVRMYIGQDANMLIIGVVPTAIAGDSMATLLGSKKPSKSLASSGNVQAVIDKYDFLNLMIGWLDFQSLAAIFIDGPTGLDKALFDLTGEALPKFSDSCKAEFKQLAKIAPRIVTGYDSISTERMQSTAVIELRQDLARELMPVAGKVPGLTTPGTGLLKFGVAFDLKAVRTFVEARVGAILNTPYECESLLDLNDSAAQAQMAFKQPIPPIVYNFQGVVVEMDGIEDMNFEAPGIPKDLKAGVLLAFNNIDALLAMGQMMMPDLAALALEPNGKAIRIPDAMLQGLTADVFAAMTDNALSIGYGNTGAKQAETMIAGAIDPRPVLMSMSIDMPAYMRMVSKMQKSTMEKMREAQANVDIESDDKDAARKVEKIVVASQAFVESLMEGYAEVFDREQVDFVVTENGLEMEANITMK